MQTGRIKGLLCLLQRSTSKNNYTILSQHIKIHSIHSHIYTQFTNTLWVNKKSLIKWKNRELVTCYVSMAKFAIPIQTHPPNT